MRILDLFSGIGGFSVAGHTLGWETAAFVERDKFCQAVLRSRFGAELVGDVENNADGVCEQAAHTPTGIPIYDDITTFSGGAFRGRCDIVTAGFPCQPFSAAGQRRGDTDDRFLWPETVRIVSEARPEWCVFENVAGLLSMVESDTLSELEIEALQLFCESDEGQGTSDEQERTREFIHRRIIGRIIGDLEAIGYSPLRMPDGTPVILCLPACAVGAWHRRDRLWIVAYDVANGGQSGAGLASVGSGREWLNGRSSGFGAEAGNRSGNGHFDLDASNGLSGLRRRQGRDDTGILRETPGKGQADEFERRDHAHGYYEFDHWLEAAGELCRVVHGLPEELDAADVQALEQAVKCLGREEAERAVGFDLGEIENRVWRTERLKALGNTIYPEVVLQVFGVIEAMRAGKEFEI